MFQQAVFFGEFPSSGTLSLIVGSASGTLAIFQSLTKLAARNLGTIACACVGSSAASSASLLFVVSAEGTTHIFANPPACDDSSNDTTWMEPAASVECCMNVTACAAGTFRASDDLHHNAWFECGTDYVIMGTSGGHVRVQLFHRRRGDIFFISMQIVASFQRSELGVHFTKSVRFDDRRWPFERRIRYHRCPR